MKAPTFVFILSTLALPAGCAKHEPAAAPAAAPPVRVTVATMQLEEAPLITEITGTVHPVRRAQIAAKVMGAIEELPVALGQPVRAGDLLVKIAAGEISARVLQARSQLNQARRDLERERSLLEKGASTDDMVKNLADRLAMTEAMVGEAEAMVAYTSVRAPFDGVVARKLVHAGDLASPGTTLLEVEGTDDFEIEAGIPDSLAERLATGTPLGVEVPVAGVRFTGTLVELAPAADAGARTVLAKISVPAAIAVRSGQFARVLVPGAPGRVLFAPAGAVTLFGQMERVFVARAGRAELRLVKTGARRDDRVEILAGLSDGEQVVINPPAGLREGQPLEVKP